MTIARSKLVDVSVSRWYHCISRCVRQAFLLGDRGDSEASGSGAGDRKVWIERRLKGKSLERTGNVIDTC